MHNKRHKIVLYNPNNVFYDMPLALLAIGSCLDQTKYNIVIIDARIHKNAHEKVLTEVKDSLCFGITVLTGKPIEEAVMISQKVKQCAPNIPVIWGGWHTSLFPEQPLLEEKSIDITVQGQGEITFKELVNAFASKRTIEGINGICYRDVSGEIRKTPPRTMFNMNDLPPADYNLIDVETYFEKKGKKQFDYISSVGCFYRCTFCADPYVYNRKFSALSSERIGAELKEHFTKYAFTDINFQDETFFTYRKRTIGVANELITRNIKTSWAATMRADQGNRLSQNDFHLLAKSGLRRVLIGVESGNQEMLDRLKKDIKKEQVMSTAKKCKENNIAAQFPFIVGFPDESEESYSESLNFAVELGNMSDLFRPVIFYFKPYPGADLTNKLVDKGFKLPNTLQEWTAFDYVTSSGPWVDPKRYIQVELIKFYILISVSRRKLLYPLKWIAKKRLKYKCYCFPIEKALFNLFINKQKLS